MNFLSKVTLLVTLSTAVFSGFAMDANVPEATNAITEFVQEYPVASVFGVVGTLILGKALYNTITGGKKAVVKYATIPAIVDEVVIPAQPVKQAPAPAVKTAGKAPVKSQPVVKAPVKAPVVQPAAKAPVKAQPAAKAPVKAQTVAKAPTKLIGLKKAQANVKK